MERFSASERESMQRFAARFSIPLVHEIGRSDLLGTACVVFANGRHYLVSAGHLMPKAWFSVGKKVRSHRVGQQILVWCWCR